MLYITRIIAIICMAIGVTAFSTTAIKSKYSFGLLRCCFNGAYHKVGSVVAEFTDACLQLSCAVNQSSSSPRAIILPVQISVGQCKGTPCGDCYSTHCVDKTGYLHPLASSWMPNNCTLCSCEAEQIVSCKAVPVSCPPQPDPFCIEVPGPCCSTWDCKSSNFTCVDDFGLVRALNEEWGTPCVRKLCTSLGIVTRIEDCNPSPLLNDSCQLITVPGECCPQVECGCVDNNGTFRRLNEEWGNPCTKNICTTQGIAIQITDCVPIQLLNESCTVYQPENQCCPEIICGDFCFDDGLVRALNEEWGSPCIQKLCTSSGIVTRIEDCNPLPFLNDSCLLITIPGECCPQVNCGCVDDMGIVRALDEEWGSPCIRNTCTTQGIVSLIIDCFPVQLLNDSCHLYQPPNQCCPEIICVDSDPCTISLLLPNGTGLTNACLPLQDPPHPNCELHIPKAGCCPEWKCGPDCRVVRCGIPEIPGSHCELYTPPLECCPVWNCSEGCIDENGIRQELGSIWHHTPCVESICTNSGVFTKAVKCTNSTPPHFNCELYNPPGKCCPEWKCGDDCRLILCVPPKKTGKNCTLFTPHRSCCPVYNCSEKIDSCLDANGNRHDLGARWYIDLCTELQCTLNGIISTKEKCNITEPPHFNCELIITDNKCCPEWNCGPDCRLVKCGQPPKPGSSCELYTPRLSCCPQWNCSCLDVDGRSYPVGSQWEKDCVNYECTLSGIRNSPIPCVLSLPEHPNCIPITSAGDCCPKWKCGPNCSLVRCVGPPNDICVADPLSPLVCCATYSCPQEQETTNGCMDGSGIIQAIGSRWVKDCISYVCSRSGIVQQKLVCSLNPPEHYNCVPVTQAGECCPKWKCGPNCAAVLCAGPPQENCKADPLPPLSCCPTYTCPQRSASSSKEIFPAEAEVFLRIPV